MKLTTLDEIGVLLIRAIRKLMGVANLHVTTSAALRTIQPVWRTYREQLNSTNPWLNATCPSVIRWYRRCVCIRLHEVFC